MMVFMSQHVRCSFAPELAVNVAARQAVLDVVDDPIIAQVDRPMVRDRAGHAHQDAVAGL
jgi:hypothetical protein